MNDAKKSKFAYELHQPQPPTVTFDRNANAAWDHGPGSCVQEFAVGLRLDISGRGDEAKLVWSDANSILAPYFINRGALVKAAAKTRAILTELSTHYRTTQDPDYIPFLSPLRAAGEELWNVLFYVTEGAESSARQIQELLLEVQDRDSLTIFSDAGVHIPWNFIYRGDATQNLTPDGTIADFSDFWSAFFQISTRFTKTNLLTKKTRPRSTFKVLYALHKDNYTAACRHLPPVQKAYLDRLLSYEIGSATNWPACREKWRRIEENDSILYLFGHSDGKMIKLDDSEDISSQLDAPRFLTTFKKRSDTRSATICFVNGCHTAAGAFGESFLALTSGPGFQGFIGTEAEVSNVFATTYGAEFMHRMCEEGKSVHQAMNELRTELFPLSMLYSCFAHGEFKVEPPASGWSKVDAERRAA
jgi:hypothetical protein